MKGPDLHDVLLQAEIETQAVRGGQVRTMEGEHAEPMFLTSSFVFDSAAEAAARFTGDEPGNVYSRYTNPTVRMFEERLALMEGGEAAVGTSSGMAAILSVCMALLQQGDHIVASRHIFGSTNVVFNKYLKKLGIDTTFVDLTDMDGWQQAIEPGRTKLFFLETPSNPVCEVVDLVALCDLAKQQGIVTLVDNCFSTPALQKPLALGADLVMHSATKFIDGQGRCLGGAVVGSQEHIEEIVGFLRSCGPTMSPFNAWVFLKGLETLSIRMKAHCENAQALAEWLQEHPKVTSVNYAGLPNHPSHELAKKQMSGFGGVLSFEVSGGQEGAWQVIDHTQIMSITANLGDTKTTITHPSTTTHGRLTEEQRQAAGIRPGLIRVAVGLENLNDLKADLARGLDLL